MRFSAIVEAKKLYNLDFFSSKYSQFSPFLHLIMKIHTFLWFLSFVLKNF